MKRSKLFLKNLALSLVAFVFLLTNTVNAHDLTDGRKLFVEGQQLNVVAPSGLSLRDAPSKLGKILDVIDFGEEVTVVNSSEVVCQSEKIDWVEGEWILVDHQGQLGFMFDGFLTNLPLPEYEFEIAYNDMDIIHSLESWVNYHYDMSLTADTLIENDEVYKTVHYFENNQKLIKTDELGYFRMDVYLSDIRIMDAYHLLLNMLPSKAEMSTFSNKSVFIEDVDGNLNTIKINLDNQVVIQKTKSGQIRIKTYTQRVGCDLSCC